AEQANKQRIKTIILRDFNIDLNKKHTHNTLIQYLMNSNMLPLINTLLPNQPIWSSQKTNSQIDEIWIPKNLIENFHNPILKDPTQITD
ncbi:29502_t:CDS:1, partial [Racocetra persica]